MSTFDGDSESDKKLWHTYVYLARKNALYPKKVNPSGSKVIADKPANRVNESISTAIQTILFSCFMLEYRLKRVLKVFNVTSLQNKTLSPLFGRFWNELSGKNKLNSVGGHCQPPQEWSSIKQDLKDLIKLRNNIAHANYDEMIQFYVGISDPMIEAQRFYNIVVDAIMLINIGTGYDPGPEDELRKYFQLLKV